MAHPLHIAMPDLDVASRLGQKNDRQRARSHDRDTYPQTTELPY
jgi:hypothetical protein